MRIVVESKHTLVVETAGRRLLLVVVAVILLHAAWLTYYLSSVLVGSVGFGGWFSVVLSLATYAAAIYLATGPYSDKRVITFHGHDQEIVIERVFFAIKFSKRIAFKEFEAFEISSHLDEGFCRLRMKHGRKRSLLKIKDNDDYELMRRLDMITRLPVDVE